MEHTCKISVPVQSKTPDIYVFTFPVFVPLFFAESPEIDTVYEIRPHFDEFADLFLTAVLFWILSILF